LHRLSEWRDRALLAAEGALKERERDARDEEI
jgi:putative transposase